MYCAHPSTVSMFDVVMDVYRWSLVVADYTDMYMYYWRLGLAGSRHLVYLYVLIDDFILRRPVPIFGPGGLVSVKQMDPVSFSTEIGNLF